MSNLRKLLFFALLVLTLLAGVGVPMSTGEIVLNINSGSDSTVWFVSGEPSLVMNGFDLGPLNLQFPARIDKVSIAVNTPVPGASINVLIYEDANGGSPIDARLVTQQQVDIRDAGTFTLTFTEPVVINQRAVWIGFYLPVNFRFLADASGSSVLTYWAWTPGGRFDVNNLASAQILGASDGSAPVNINLGGKARITAEISGAAPTTVTGTPGATTQLAGGQGDLSIMRQYPHLGCETLFIDSQDISITYRGSISYGCSLAQGIYAPPNPQGYIRQQPLYEITFYRDTGEVLSDWLPSKVTHCVRPNPVDIDRAVIGLAYGSPRKWEIRPTARFGDFICAEIGRGGYLSYFVSG